VQSETTKGEVPESKHTQREPSRGQADKQQFSQAVICLCLSPMQEARKA